MVKKHVHEKRGITFAEYGALLGTRAMLAKGDLELSRRTRAVPGKHLFNMSTSGNESECSSVGCIGGTMAMVMGKDPDDFVSVLSKLAALFFPPQGDLGWITPRIAVKAIDNWLATGKPEWRKLKKAAKKAKVAR